MSDETKPKAKTNTTKCKVGDYVTRDDWVLLRIAAVIGDGSNPLYGVTQYGKDDITWFTQHELDTKGMYKVTPDFRPWQAIQEGDIVRLGVARDRPYVKVIARVDDLVMLSMRPTPKKERDTLDKLTSQIAELTEGVIDEEVISKHVGPTYTMQDAHKSAAAEWMPVERLAYMHWQLLSNTDEV